MRAARRAPADHRNRRTANSADSLESPAKPCTESSGTPRFVPFRFLRFFRSLSFTRFTEPQAPNATQRGSKKRGRRSFDVARATFRFFLMPPVRGSADRFFRHTEQT